MIFQERDYSYVNPLEEISTVTKVMFAVFLVSVFLSILCCYCLFKCCWAMLKDPYRRDASPNLTSSAVETQVNIVDFSTFRL